LDTHNNGEGEFINVEDEKEEVDLEESIQDNVMHNKLDHFNDRHKSISYDCITYSYCDPFLQLPFIDEHIRYISSKHKRKKLIPQVICQVALDSNLFIKKLPRLFNDSCKSLILNIIANLIVLKLLLYLRDEWHDIFIALLILLGLVDSTLPLIIAKPPLEFIKF
jgi:hypothetical protein